MAHGYYANGKWYPTDTEEEAVAGWLEATQSGSIPITPVKDDVQHGYYDDNKEFVKTNTLEEAVDAWRSNQGLSTGGIYDMGDGRIVDTRNISPASVVGGVSPLIDQQGPVAPEVAGLVEQAPTYQSQLETLGITLSDDPYAGIEDFFAQGQDDPNFMGGQPVGSRYQAAPQLQEPVTRPYSHEEFRLSQYDRLSQSKYSQDLVRYGMSGPLAFPTVLSGMGVDESQHLSPANYIDPRTGLINQNIGLKPSQVASYPETEETPLFGETSPEQLLGSAWVAAQDEQYIITGRFVDRFMEKEGALPLPENILLGFGEDQEPNRAFEDIRNKILLMLQRAIVEDPTVARLAQLSALTSAQSLHDFYGILGYAPTEANPNIYTYIGIPQHESAADQETVANLILGAGSGSGYYGGTQSIIDSGGGGGGFTPASQSWGHAPSGLYMWRIGA